MTARPLITAEFDHRHPIAVQLAIESLDRRRQTFRQWHGLKNWRIPGKGRQRTRLDAEAKPGQEQSENGKQR